MYCTSFQTVELTSRSLKVNDIYAIRQDTYNLMLVFYCNYMCLSRTVSEILGLIYEYLSRSRAP